MSKADALNHLLTGCYLRLSLYDRRRSITYVLHKPLFVLCHGVDNEEHIVFRSKPVPNDSDWPTYTKEHPKYYILNGDKYGTGKGPRTTACAFWNDFLPRLKSQPEICQKKGDKLVMNGKFIFIMPTHAESNLICYTIRNVLKKDLNIRRGSRIIVKNHRRKTVTIWWSFLGLVMYILRTNRTFSSDLELFSALSRGVPLWVILYRCKFHDNTLTYTVNFGYSEPLRTSIFRSLYPRFTKTEVSDVAIHTVLVPVWDRPRSISVLMFAVSSNLNILRFDVLMFTVRNLNLIWPCRYCNVIKNVYAQDELETIIGEMNAEQEERKAQEEEEEEDEEEEEEETKKKR
ncbi:hypothetical protein ANN_17873 [Periplaneta americana]|uniref:Uncharacterized protein n=1 Tax=Periplaneta americana TaxID=6978 RepID=A0ABQ8SU50_PERAM|nr:hypothetical protein ANN_17873 [Periplaneta americana]